MAKTSNKTTIMFLNMVLILSLLLGESAASCETVVGVESGDTCISIAKASQLTTDFFLSINPNVNCKELFVGQWVCVAGSPN
ncbi:hypothetical protein LOK49_LG09G01809 [Camellia lanceoleosa]|uniref:Uncharacterized protein n=1 Tax=Camellia lanceoleosa TaxID=1840588 RepID=A0ACC0GF08_9ERIC|nr:hypothetical protein LOK49_LG09G01809 [Camellia lanceoleosa]